MPNRRTLALSHNPVTVAASIVALLVVVYLGLIAMIVSYAALTVEFAHSIRNDEATIAGLESEYLARVAELTAVDYQAAGYARPVAERFVTAPSATARR